MRSLTLNLMLVATLVATALSQNTQAQSPVTGLRGTYQPLNQLMPPGSTGYWSAAIGRAEPGVFQNIRVSLPGNGTVTFFDGPAARPVTLAAPAQIGVGVGYTYRFKISEMPDYPGVELYPSIEILDRLHPPAGEETRFPIPVDFTADEINSAIRGRLVTKVVYLEQPQMAYYNARTTRNGIIDVPASRNLMAEADQAGRPMILIRLGGRVPDLRTEDLSFFATGAPLAPVANEQQP